jgi:hypothetical protein
MKWRQTARVYNALALLPSSLSYTVHYWMQRHFGGKKKLNTISALRKGIRICRKIVERGSTPLDKVFFEIGTGRRICMPIAFWLLGSRKVLTVDLHPYLRSELVEEDLVYIQQHETAVRALFEGLAFSEERFERLLRLAKNLWDLSDMLALCDIKYIAPADAANLSIPDGSVDYHTSNLVLHEIDPPVLKSVLREGNRVVKDGGLFVHNIDLSDEFAQSDDTITSVNFLRFSDKEWERITANKYMRMNRLRIDDYQELFRQSGQTVLSIESKIDPRALKVLQDGSLTVDGRFRGKSPEAMATVASWIVSEKSV